MKTVDACGLTCPAPVLLVKDTVEKEDAQELVVLVDNQASSENVTRFLTTRGYQVESEEDGNTIRLIAVQGEGSVDSVQPDQTSDKLDSSRQKNVVLIMTDKMGNGDDELGSKLMVNYVKTLKEMGDDLWQLVFVNGGVRLTVKGSPLIEELQEYEKSGVTILACGTCLEHFGLTSEKEVGQTTNMLDIVMATQLADKVVTIG